MVVGGLSTGTLGSLAAACSGDDGASPAGGDPIATDAEKAIDRIGRRYRQEYPEEDDVEELVSLLGIDAGSVASPDDLPAFSSDVVADYEASRTVRLDGWVLSVTEGRAAALISLV